MSTDERLIFLITKAASIVGSEYRLAKNMGIPPQTITGWKAGRRTCTAGDRVRLAGFAGEDAQQEAARALIAGSTGIKRAQLEQLLGKALTATGEGLHSLAAVLFTVTYGISNFDIPRCIFSRASARYTTC